VREVAASVVIVTFNSGETVGACVASIPPDFEAVIVDQASGDGSAAAAAAARPDAVIVRAAVNRGFGAGCNLGASNSRGEVIIFLNPDAQLGPDRGQPLIETLERRGVGLAGPRIVDLDGREVTRCRRWGNPLRDVLDVVCPQHLLPSRLRQDVPASDPVYVRGGPVAYVQGSCMAVRRATFEDVGGFDEAFFLYSEEESLAERLRARGLTAWLEPRATVTHVGHTSTDKTGTFATEQYFRSRSVLYLNRYGPVRGSGASLLLGAGLVLLLVTAPLRARIGVRRAETARFCLAGLAGIGGALLRRPVRPPGAGARASASVPGR
jgi:N-acetylglucosaminyl-diphospho-decaprenol L-rhamnosyltransferase